MAWILMQQVAVLFLLMGLGIVLKKRGIVNEAGATMMSNLVLVIVVPSVLIQAFQRELKQEMLLAIGTAFFLAVLFHVLAVVVTHWVPRPRDDNQYPVERILAIGSNCGFMGIPLMTAIMGDVGAMYAAMYVAVFNLYLWSHGVMTLRRTKTIRLKEVFLSPGILGVVIGLLLLFLQWKLPLLLHISVEYLAAMNTPLPTIVTGVFLADVPLLQALKNKRIYLASALRLVILPALLVALICLLRVPQWFPDAATVALAAVISSACSGAITAVMMPARYGCDASHGAAMVAVSTLFSILTIPAVATVANWLFLQYL